MPLDVKITLTPAQVQEAIRVYLKTQGFDTTSIKFSAIMSRDSYDRFGSPIFDGATASVVPSNKNTTFNSLASQIAAVESDGRQFGDH